jgi:hypothetical protein
MVQTNLAEKMLLLGNEIVIDPALRSHVPERVAAILTDALIGGLLTEFIMPYEEFEAVSELQSHFRRLSHRECFTLYYALRHKALVITPQPIMAEAVYQCRLESAGYSWVFDSLFDVGLISRHEATTKWHEVSMIAGRHLREEFPGCLSRYRDTIHPNAGYKATIAVESNRYKR